MNVLILIPTLVGGGQEKAAAMICNYLVQYHKVSVVCLQTGTGNEEPYHCPVYRIEVPLKNNTAGKVTVMLKRRAALRKLKTQLKPEVSIAFGETAILLNAISGGSEKKIASMRQSLYKAGFTNPEYGYWYSRLLGYALQKHTLTVTVCNELKEQLQKKYAGLDCRFIYNAIDLGEVQSKKEADPGIAVHFFNKPVLAHMGRFDISKGHWHLAHIFVLLKHQLPGVKLLLAGNVDESNPLNRKIFDYCLEVFSRNNLKVCQLNDQPTAADTAAADVMITGHSSNPFPLMARSAAFIFPSTWEGFPNAVLEAMAAGLPVVSTACQTGPSEILQADKNYGILMPPFTRSFQAEPQAVDDIYQSWVNALLPILADDATREKWQQLSLQRAAFFSTEKILPAWKALVESVDL